MICYSTGTVVLQGLLQAHEKNWPSRMDYMKNYYNRKPAVSCRSQLINIYLNTSRECFKQTFIHPSREAKGLQAEQFAKSRCHTFT